MISAEPTSCVTTNKFVVVDAMFKACILAVAVLLTPLISLIMSCRVWNRTTCEHAKLLSIAVAYAKISSCICATLLASTCTGILAKVLRIAEQKRGMTS